MSLISERFHGPDISLYYKREIELLESVHRGCKRFRSLFPGDRAESLKKSSSPIILLVYQMDIYARFGSPSLQQQPCGTFMPYILSFRTWGEGQVDVNHTRGTSRTFRGLFDRIPSKKVNIFFCKSMLSIIRLWDKFIPVEYHAFHTKPRFPAQRHPFLGETSDNPEYHPSVPKCSNYVFPFVPERSKNVRFSATFIEVSCFLWQRY